MCLQLADQSLRYPLGIAENIKVKIREFFDFMVLDMHPDSRMSLIPRKYPDLRDKHLDSIITISNAKREY